MLSVKNLCKSFKIHSLGGKDIPGFSSINFNIAKGKSLSLSGPSGTGKSSVLKCIYRTYLPSGGEIIYNSDNFGKINLAAADEHTIIKLRKNEIGYVTQFLRVLPRVATVDIVAEPLVLNGENKTAARKKAKEILERLRIPEELWDAYPVTFSGGEQQRVNIAKAVIAKPKLLLLDEPTASLDRDSVGIVVEILNELKQSGTTMIMIFHDKEIMGMVSDNIYKMPEMEKSYVCM